MGRPINKRFLGDAAGSIKVSQYFRVGGEEINGDDDTYIVSQRSTNKFLIADTDGAWTEIMTLVDKAAGALLVGEFRINATDADGTETNAVRLYNRTVRVSGAVKTVWDIDAPTEITIVSISEANPAVIEVADTSVFDHYGEETVTIDGGDMTEIDGAYVVTIINATTFSIPVDSTGFTTYTANGVVRGAGAVGSIDTQDA